MCKMDRPWRRRGFIVASLDLSGAQVCMPGASPTGAISRAGKVSGGLSVAATLDSDHAEGPHWSER